MNLGVVLGDVKREAGGVFSWCESVPSQSLEVGWLSRVQLLNGSPFLWVRRLPRSRVLLILSYFQCWPLRSPAPISLLTCSSCSLLLLSFLHSFSTSVLPRLFVHCSVGASLQNEWVFRVGMVGGCGLPVLAFPTVRGLPQLIVCRFREP